MIKSGTEPIPGFRLEELLGKGQFGEVWRARSPGNTYVAMKFLQLSGGHGWKEYRAIQRVKQIRHANLMPIIAIWLLDDDGQVIGDDVIDTIETGIGDTGVVDRSKATLVIEPVGKSQRPVQMVIETPLGDQTLRQRLADCQAEGHTGIPADELLRYLEEAAKGLGFLNTARQVGDSHIAVQHCDVKPDNVMLMGGSAVVTDFGVAQAQSALGSDLTATSLGGTPAYMAPECFKGKTSHATDQYALAVTYYELRTGELPFTERTYAAVYDAHRTGSLDFSAVPHREQAVLRHATASDPDQRYESCSERGRNRVARGEKGPAQQGRQSQRRQVCEGRPDLCGRGRRGRRSGIRVVAAARPRSPRDRRCVAGESKLCRGDRPSPNARHR
jgi:serine/threonine protein kinase